MLFSMRVPCHLLPQRQALQARVAIALCGKGGEAFAPPCFARVALCVAAGPPAALHGGRAARAGHLVPGSGGGLPPDRG
eukprot:11182073-Lingulodinium_polyedra.AAC.1